MQDRLKERQPLTPVQLDLVRAEADLLRSQAITEVTRLIGRYLGRLFQRPTAA